MDQYDFSFLNDQQPQVKKQGNQKKQLLIFAIGVLIFVLIIVIVLATIFGSKQDTRQILLPVAATQDDLIDIVDSGKRELRDNAVLNQSTSVGLVISSQKNSITSYLGKSPEKAYAIYRNTEYESTLEEALSNGTYDKTYATILNQRLDLYLQQLVTAYSQLENPNVKQQIAKIHDEAKQLADSK